MFEHGADVYDQRDNIGVAKPLRERVYASDMICFKVTASPNKSTCMFLYCDGTFKVSRTPQESYRVCFLLGDTILKAHSSFMCSAVMSSIVPLEEPESQKQS